MTHENPAATLRAILEAIPHPGGLEALGEMEHQLWCIRDQFDHLAESVWHQREASAPESGIGPKGTNHGAASGRWTWKHMALPVTLPIALLGAVVGVLVTAWREGYDAMRRIDL